MLQVVLPPVATWVLCACGHSCCCPTAAYAEQLLGLRIVVGNCNRCLDVQGSSLTGVCRWMQTHVSEITAYPRPTRTDINKRALSCVPLQESMVELAGPMITANGWGAPSRGAHRCRS